MSKQSKVKPIPEGYSTITPGLTIRGAVGAIDFYQRAFGAETLSAFKLPDGRLMHAELKIGDSRLFLSEEFPEMGCPGPTTLGGTTSSLFLYVTNVDQAFERAVRAGATVKQPVQDMFWGDRFGSLTDPYGHNWSLATRTENVPPDELQRRGLAWAKEMAAKQGGADG